MKALVLKGPDDFAIEEVADPEPEQFEVLCEVRAVTICGTDSHLIRGRLPGFLATRISVHPWPRVGGRDRGPGGGHRIARLVHG